MGRCKVNMRSSATFLQVLLRSGMFPASWTPLNASPDPHRGRKVRLLLVTAAAVKFPSVDAGHRPISGLRACGESFWDILTTLASANGPPALTIRHRKLSSLLLAPEPTGRTPESRSGAADPPMGIETSNSAAKKPTLDHPVATGVLGGVFPPQGTCYSAIGCPVSWPRPG